ncbi:carboxypeptidase-like regulatory domain-containing protein [Curtobacterium poinsettiae]|uniref:Carboxypeptidase regulatory-like domain-containing protein n=1 Tax=Curtobacterium poinsettiae TaxID=159612 RepID=A0ABT3RXX3_9MICO|nr:carboxypeptidase-like regulatory domain-containing protein [Curtobacterium flaccumfaciens]MBT1611311.1 carboxypeptidase regulatory-like domain-containing protein [Curtobacterium flaccumfaciens pv. poinsettiae]MCX2847448.1 carboxypeptidase regulatory-like domain-containing protein [Curtobacterium flaccumfaciens pv. poinsettiae]UXN17457.1 carboxypeptidase regulatory-like domain-containing protein [Curtobacterium flaccumfaciens pv. poinsettiae]
MRRWRAVTAGLTALALGAGLAIGGATSASAEPVGNWGTFTLSGASRAYTGTMTLAGFPETTFTSDSRQSTVVSGASTWQSASTPSGAVYGTSRGTTYMNQRPNVDSPTTGASTTTYTFAEPTPGAQSWSFVLGDVDADRATISATVSGGGAATAEQLGYVSSYNSCSAAVAGGPSCTADPDDTTGQDRPTWDPATRTLRGNTGAVDTAGATAWFTPTVSLTSLTITYHQRSGFPGYQTWFANRTAAITGTATLDGAPIPGAIVRVTAPRGTVYTTTTDPDGTYAFPQLPVIANYRVEITPPDGAEGPDQPTRVSLAQAGSPGGVDQQADFAFTSPEDTVSVIGTVVDEDGRPVSNLEVVITDPDSGDVLVDTTTNSDGVYTGSDLPADTDLDVSVADEPPVTITTGDDDAAPVVPDVIDAAAAVVATVAGAVSLDGASVPAGAVVELVDGTGAVVASTETDADGRYVFATAAGTYTVRTERPEPGATGATSNTGVTAVAGERASSDLPFASAATAAEVTTDQPGTVVDTNGEPVPDVEVVAAPTDTQSGDPVSVVTDDDGAFDLTGLEPTTEYVVSVDVEGAEAATVVTPESGAATPLAFVVRAAVGPAPAPSPSPSPSGAPSAAPTVPAAGSGSGSAPVSGQGDAGDGGPLAYTGADLGPGLIAAGVLVLLGAALLVYRAVRNRRRTDHLQD